VVRWLGLRSADSIAPLVRTSLRLVAVVVAAHSVACGAASGGTTDGSSDTSTTTPTGGSGGTGYGGAGGAGGAPATTTSSTSSSTSQGGAGGSGPIACNQKYTSLAAGPCDLLQQDCQPGYTCRPWPVGNGFTTMCLANSGLKSRGAPCNGDVECEAHLFCTGAPGQCSPICCPANDELCGGGRCNLTFALSQTDWVSLCTYLTQCTLLTKNACPAGTECHLQDAQQGSAACVAPSGTSVPEGGACKYINDCHDMQLCDAGTCRYNCLVGAAGQGQPPGLGGCPAGQTCKDVKTGIDGIGICEP
jgi:hypothetical protein